MRLTNSEKKKADKETILLLYNNYDCIVFSQDDQECLLYSTENN